MRIGTDLFFRFANLLEGAGKSALLDGSEQEAALPSVIAPILPVSQPLKKLSGFVAADQQLDSFARDDLTARANQGLTNIVICTFGAGYWWVTVSAFALANWTQASDGTVNLLVHLRDPDGVDEGLLGLHIINGVQTRARGSWLFGFQEAGWAIRAAIPGNGAGQTHELRTCVHAVRLL